MNSAHYTDVSSYAAGTRVLFGHNGRTVGFAFILLHDVATGVTVVVLANDEHTMTQLDQPWHNHPTDTNAIGTGEPSPGITP